MLAMRLPEMKRRLFEREQRLLAFFVYILKHHDFPFA
ncbi:hypothetical protein PHAMO_270270 [Magnetospirillum molischianum DSM 120]|uniref:Uncharacterized protein n=1 Tax=Magnetospirillum molischianum DSM 120 TaxID=1150626 RepID=H8FSU1_MAGML|nr:hypothetical protein PHAMO_270270 [Magnetospirillum molischianum DSM 120]